MSFRIKFIIIFVLLSIGICLGGSTALAQLNKSKIKSDWTKDVSYRFLSIEGEKFQRDIGEACNTATEDIPSKCTLENCNKWIRAAKLWLKNCSARRGAPHFVKKMKKRLKSLRKTKKKLKKLAQSVGESGGETLSGEEKLPEEPCFPDKNVVEIVTTNPQSTYSTIAKLIKGNHYSEALELCQSLKKELKKQKDVDLTMDNLELKETLPTLCRGIRKKIKICQNSQVQYLNELQQAGLNAVVRKKAFSYLMQWKTVMEDIDSAQYFRVLKSSTPVTDEDNDGLSNGERAKRIRRAINENQFDVARTLANGYFLYSDQISKHYGLGVNQVMKSMGSAFMAATAGKRKVFHSLYLLDFIDELELLLNQLTNCYLEKGHQIRLVETRISCFKSHMEEIGECNYYTPASYPDPKTCRITGGLATQIFDRAIEPFEGKYKADKKLLENLKRQQTQAAIEKERRLRQKQLNDPAYKKATLTQQICIGMKRLAFVEKQIEKEYKIGNATGYVNALKLHRLGEQQISLEERIAEFKRKYHKVTKDGFSDSLCKP